MARPILLLIDDEPEVLRALERDTRRHFGKDFRVLQAGSGVQALDALKRLAVRNEPVALFLTDQRMPSMSGIDFLAQARNLYPQAKRILLTAYADTEVAIRAINTVRLDYYLVKPWDPPEEHLYPVLQDVLDDWLADFHPPFEGIRLIGHRWSPTTHELKDFFTRNLIPYQWLDIETRREASHLLALAGLDDTRLPVVLLPAGNPLIQPTYLECAEELGLRTHANNLFYDLAIIGSGPAGLAGAVYGASEGLRTVLIEREAPGGQAGTSSRIENYLGFPAGLSGGDLARRAVAQARRFGVELLTPQAATGLRLSDFYRVVMLADGTELYCSSLLIASGVSYSRLDIPGVERLTGAGVYYGAALTEALSCRDSDVFLVGGANSAGQAALYFSRYARRVTILVRSDSLAKRMSHYLIDQIQQTSNIAVRTGTSVVEAHGETNLEALTLLHNETGKTYRESANALFIFIGTTPHTDWLAHLLQRDERGFLLTGPDLGIAGKQLPGWHLKRSPFLLETNIPGIFAAGDVRHGSIKRVASSVGEGSVAIQFIHQYLSEVR
jgi:thioredoxin reductase (NADPH)